MATEKVGIYRKYHGPIPTDKDGLSDGLDLTGTGTARVLGQGRRQKDSQKLNSQILEVVRRIHRQELHLKSFCRNMRELCVAKWPLQHCTIR
jgi:hypothetical protein